MEKKHRIIRYYNYNQLRRISQTLEWMGYTYTASPYQYVGQSLGYFICTEYHYSLMPAQLPDNLESNTIYDYKNQSQKNRFYTQVCKQAVKADHQHWRLYALGVHVWFGAKLNENSHLTVRPANPELCRRNLLRRYCTIYRNYENKAANVKYCFENNILYDNKKLLFCDGWL